MNINTFTDKMFDIMSMMDDERMDFPIVVFHQFKKHYPDCQLNFSDISIVKQPLTNTFQYTYTINFSNDLKIELSKNYPESLI